MLRIFDARLGWRLSGLGIAGAQALYQTTITLTLSFVVFTFGSLLVAIQIAGGQLTPRIIATTLLRDNVVRYSVGLFVFTLIFAIMALNRLDKTVYEIVSLVAAAAGDSLHGDVPLSHRLRGAPAAAGQHPCPRGRRRVDGHQGCLPGTGQRVAGTSRRRLSRRRAADASVPHAGGSAIVLAVDFGTLVADARRADGIIELVPQVGDFVATDEPLFELYGGAVSIANHRLQSRVAFGPERTLEQDPLFAFRIIADIALKALSPAINDPTTGVLALDQLNRLLRAVGRRRLRGDDHR